MVHLHVHSEYSLRDSIIKVPDLVSRAEEIGAVALTDHGNMSGSFEFWLECFYHNVKPIIGMEAYVVPNVEIRQRGEKRFHLVLLARNAVGYHNLLKMASLAGTEGFYYVPRIDLEMVKPYREGIVALTACLQSVLYMAGDDEQNMIKMLRLLLRVFPVYLEIMPHDMDDQRKHNLKLYNFSESMGIPILLTQDCHYLDQCDKEAHDMLMRIQGRDPYIIDLHISDVDWIISIMSREHKYLPYSAVHDAIDTTMLLADSIKDYGLSVDNFDYPEFELEGDRNGRY